MLYITKVIFAVPVVSCVYEVILNNITPIFDKRYLINVVITNLHSVSPYTGKEYTLFQAP